MPTAISQIPPELWAMVAALSGRQTIARLSAVSHAFYSVFASMLYRDMTTGTDESPLHWTRIHLLVRTLRELHDSPLKITRNPHPAKLVLRLRIPGFCASVAECVDALRNLVEISPSNGQISISTPNSQLVRGAALRALLWDSSTRGADEVADFLRTPGYFPNLKDLSVCCGLNTRFECFRVLGLEKLECRLEFDGSGYDEWRASWAAFRRAMADLPASSPLLHALSLEIHLTVDSGAAEDPSPWDIDAELGSAINALRLPALTAFKFSLHASDLRIRDPAMDFSPLLQAHPCLTAVTLNIEGICVPPEISMDTAITFLSRLESFTGSVKNCAAVLPHARGLHQLSVLFPADASEDLQNTLDHQSPRPFTPTVFPPHAFPGVTSLDARAVDPNGETARYAWTFLPDSLICLVDAFPNLTRLKVSLTGSLHDYCAGFAALQMLEQLSVRVHKHPPMSDYGRRAAELYPAEPLAVEINFGALKLGRLPVLAEVHVLLWADRSDTYITGCESCDKYQDVWWDLEVEYWFERRVDIVGKGEEFRLIRMTASDEKEGEGTGV